MHASEIDVDESLARSIRKLAPDLMRKMFRKRGLDSAKSTRRNKITKRNHSSSNHNDFHAKDVLLSRLRYSRYPSTPVMVRHANALMTRTASVTCTKRLVRTQSLLTPLRVTGQPRPQKASDVVCKLYTCGSDAKAGACMEKMARSKGMNASRREKIKGMRDGQHTDEMPLSAYTLYAWRVLTDVAYGLKDEHVCWRQRTGMGNE